MDSLILVKIRTVIAECEKVQESNESQYTKECAKRSAYDLIKQYVRKEPLDGKG